MCATAVAFRTAMMVKHRRNAVVMSKDVVPEIPDPSILWLLDHGTPHPTGRLLDLGLGFGY